MITFTPLGVDPVQLTTSAATLYTVPASTITTIECITVCNESGSTETFTLSIGTDASGKRLFDSTVLQPNQTLIIQGKWVLTTTKVIQGKAGNNSVVNVTMAGFERTTS